MSNLLGRIGARALAATLVAAVAGAGAAPVSLVTNGDFETGPYAGWTKSGSTPNSGSALYTGLGGIYGSTTVGFGAGGSYSGLLSQVIGTRAGSTYQLSFDYGWFAGCNCGDGAQSLRAEINGVTLATVVDNSTSYFLDVISRMRQISGSLVHGWPMHHAESLGQCGKALV